MKINILLNSSLKKKIVTAVFITASVAAFAALGDGKKEGGKKSQQTLLSKPSAYNFKTFSLKPRFNYRGGTILSNQQGRYITLNTVATYQKGNTTYILPMKKKVLLDKIKFNPAH
jgi:hypothetical protein